MGSQVIRQIQRRLKLAALNRVALKLQSGQNRRQRFFRRVTAGFGLASAILVGFGFVSYRSLSDLIYTTDWQFQNYKVLEEIKDIRSDIQKAAIAKHRYITTGDSSYLEPGSHKLSKITLHAESPSTSPSIGSCARTAPTNGFWLGGWHFGIEKVTQCG